MNVVQGLLLLDTLFDCELLCISHRVRHALAAVVAHRNELDALRCKTSQFTICFLPVYVSAWNGLPDAVFEFGWLNSGLLGGFKGAVNRWLLP